MKLSSHPKLDNLSTNKKSSTKLWVLRLRPDSEWVEAYDTVQGFVVRASSSKEARLIASAQCGDEGSQVWLDSLTSSCTELTSRGKPEVILCDFLAG